MDLFGPRQSTMAIFLFFIIISPLGIVAVVVDRPIWSEVQWKSELEIDREKHRPDVKGGADGPIPQLIECALKSRGCDDSIRELLLNEIFLRNKRFKSYGEECNSAGTQENELVANPPKYRNREIQLNYPKYLIWQENLINSKLKFCDPHEFLRCSAEKKCVCLSGSVRVGNVCFLSHGAKCTLDPDPEITFGPTEQEDQLYFDPFQTIQTLGDGVVKVLTPGCQKGDECIEDSLASYYKHRYYCVDKGSEPLRVRRLKVQLYLKDSLPLPFDAKCNSQDHNRFFTSTKEEDENQAVRFKTLEDFQIRGVKFCDLEKFLTCGPSEKCECMSPSSRKDNKCVLLDQLDRCGINPETEPILMNKTLVSRAREKLMVGFASAVTVEACEGNLTCHSDMMEMYCTCPNGTTGQKCEETLTRFLSIVRVPSLPTDVAGYPAKVKVFSHFNKIAVEFEKVFRQGVTVCDWKTQNEAEILVGRIRKLMFRGTSMTKKQYEELGKLIEDFTTSQQPTHHNRRHRICDGVSRCKYSTLTCVHLTRRDYLQDLVNEAKKSKSPKCNEAGCSKFLKHFNDDMYGGDQFEFYGGEGEMEYNRIIEEYSKFCLPCPVVVQSKSVAHHCHLPDHFVLLMPVGTFFVVSNY